MMGGRQLENNGLSTFFFAKQLVKPLYATNLPPH